jgi:hypothetical protein
MLSALTRNSSALSRKRSPFLDMVALPQLQSEAYRPPELIACQAFPDNVSPAFSD